MQQEDMIHFGFSPPVQCMQKITPDTGTFHQEHKEEKVGLMSIEDIGAAWDFTSVESECRLSCIISYVQTRSAPIEKQESESEPLRATSPFKPTIHISEDSECCTPRPPSTQKTLLKATLVSRPPGCFIPIFERGRPSGQFLAASPL